MVLWEWVSSFFSWLRSWFYETETKQSFLPINTHKVDEE